MVSAHYGGWIEQGWDQARTRSPLEVVAGMTESGMVQLRARDLHVIARTIVLAVLAVPAGLGLSVVGFLGWCVGPLTIITGLVGKHVRRGWASWVIPIGVGLTLGALAYIAIGLLMPDGPSSGSGSTHH
ncbi:MAG TPA: hypothetical protein VK103_00480 [Bacillota bacterium]|nr:hypothetical protein [Bacillota bacterium]